MNSNKGAAAAAAGTPANAAKKALEDKVIKMFKTTLYKDKAGKFGEAGKTYSWRDALPAQYHARYGVDPSTGLEVTYAAPVREAIKKGDEEMVIRVIVSKMIEQRLTKTRGMEGKAAVKAEEKASRAATPRAKSAKRSAAEIAEEAEKKLAELKAKAAEEAKKKNIAPKALNLARRMKPDFNALAPQTRGKIMKNAEYALEKGGPNISVANAIGFAKTRRSTSRAASAAKKAAATTGMSLANMANGAAAAAAPVTATRRNYKKEITITDFCKESAALQAKSATPLSVSDVLHMMAEARGATRAKSSSKYAALKAVVNANAFGVANEENGSAAVVAAPAKKKAAAVMEE